MHNSKIKWVFNSQSSQVENKVKLSLSVSCLTGCSFGAESVWVSTELSQCDSRGSPRAQVRPEHWSTAVYTKLISASVKDLWEPVSLQLDLVGV